MPNIAWAIRRRRLTWGAGYAGGYLYNQELSAYSHFSHRANFNLQYRLSPHVTLILHDNFSRVPQLASQLPTSVSTTGAGAIQQPSQTLLVNSQVLEQDNVATAQVTYQYSAADVVGVGTTNYITRFGQPPAGAPQTLLLNSESYEGDGFYNHRFNPQHQVGVTYSFDTQRYNLEPGSETVDSHSILGLYTYTPKPKLELALFAGPEYFNLNANIITTTITVPTVTVTDLPVAQDHWIISAGGTLTWQTGGTGLNATVSRKVSDGGGLTSAVDLLSVNGGIRRQIIRGSVLEVGGGYGKGKALEQLAGALGQLQSFNVTATWTQNIGRNFITTVGFAQDYQKQQGQVTQQAPANTVLNLSRSRAWVTFGYQFGKSLGR
jgi:hypothetical protein